MIFELLPIALAITLEPIPLTAFTLVLGSERGTRKGAMFILGWMLSMAIVVALTLLATGNNPPRPHTAPSVAARFDPAREDETTTRAGFAALFAAQAFGIEL